MASSRILLNGGAYSTIPRSDGSFVFYGVPVGTYLLEVNNVPYLFETLRLDVSAHEGGGRIKAAPLTRRERLPYPLLLRPVVEAQYFQVCTYSKMASLGLKRHFLHSSDPSLACF